MKRSHRLLLVGQRNAHLFQRDFVEGPGNLDAFSLLILSESISRRIVKLTDRFPAVEAAPLQHGLRLVYLFLGCTKDWATLRFLFRARCLVAAGCGIRGLG